MPYMDKICTACDFEGERYHNVRKCPKCGNAALVLANPWNLSGQYTLRRENLALRSEVNALRARLGLGAKYREWLKPAEAATTKPTKGTK